MIIYNEEKKELIIPTGIGNIDNTIYYDEGFTDGYSSGRTDGYHEGYGNGYQRGFTDGYASGFTDGHNSGFTDGYTSGFTDGYRSATTVPVEMVLVYNFDDPDTMHPISCLNIQLNGMDVQYEYDSASHLYWAYAHLQVPEYDISVISSVTIDFLTNAEESSNSKTYKTITINGTDATIISYNIISLGEERKYRITYNIEPVDITKYGLGFIDGWNSAHSKTIEFTLYKNEIIFAYINDAHMYINGIRVPIVADNKWFQGRPSYIKLSGQTDFTTITSFEYVANIGGALPDYWDNIEINGVPITPISQYCERIGDDLQTWHYSFYFDNAPVYDKRSYEAGLAACQNNENQ